VIKGDSQIQAITFFFFTKLDQNPRYDLDPGKRYIISVRNEGGVFRSWADASQLRIEVHSGSHKQKDLPLDLGPRAVIAYILLTPGEDCDFHEFASRLDWPPLSSDDPGYVNQRLRQLELSSNSEVRDRACLTAASLFWYRPPCLKQALENSDANIRMAATNGSPRMTRIYRDCCNTNRSRFSPSLGPTIWRKPSTSTQKTRARVSAKPRATCCAGWRRGEWSTNAGSLNSRLFECPPLITSSGAERLAPNAPCDNQTDDSACLDLARGGMRRVPA